MRGSIPLPSASPLERGTELSTLPKVSKAPLCKGGRGELTLKLSEESKAPLCKGGRGDRNPKPSPENSPNNSLASSACVFCGRFSSFPVNAYNTLSANSLFATPQSRTTFSNHRSTNTSLGFRCVSPVNAKYSRRFAIGGTSDSNCAPTTCNSIGKIRNCSPLKSVTRRSINSGSNRNCDRLVNASITCRACDCVKSPK